MQRNSRLFPTVFEKATTGWDSLFAFLWGFLGLQVVALLLQLVGEGLALADESLSIGVQFGAYALTALGMFLYFRLRRPAGLKVLGLGFAHWRSLVYGLGLFMGFAVLSNIYSSIMEAALPWLADNANETAIVGLTERYPLLMFLTTVLFAPFLEELTYRGGLGTLIARKNRWAGFFVQAAVFALIHFDFVGAIDEAETGSFAALYLELANLPLYVLAGLGLGAAYMFTGNLAASMTAHALNNLLSFVFVLL